MRIIPISRLRAANRLGRRMLRDAERLQRTWQESQGYSMPVRVRNRVARERAFPYPAGGIDTPDPGRFLNTTFSNQAGSRRYRLYVPTGYHGAPVPLVIMLHGCAQTPEDFAVGTRMNAMAEELIFLAAYPAQTETANHSRCWNWFNLDEQRRDHGEPSLIAGITRDIMTHYAVDGRRVYVAGLSAGGAEAAIMGARYPDLYAAIGVHSGLACGAARDLSTAFTAMREGHAGQGHRLIPAIVFHGDRDNTVNPANADAVIAQSVPEARQEARVTKGRVPDGHAYTRTVYGGHEEQALEQWLVHGGGHGWMGGSPAGSFTDPRGPDATREMLRFFLEHPKPLAA